MWHPPMHQTTLGRVTPRLAHQVRILTWNIHKGIGGVDRRYDLGRTMAVIENAQPDIALLQEVAQGMPRLRQDDQVELLSGTFGGHAAFHPEHQFKVGGYGNLILSRWPMDSFSHIDLTIGFHKTRGLLQAHVRAHIDDHQHTLIVHNLHLGLAGSERGEQLRRFLDCRPFKSIHQTTPVIVGGDLNDLWGSLGPRFLAPAGFTRAGALAASFPALFPLRPLDGLFFRGALRAVRSHVLNSKLAKAASDHLPLVADFELVHE
jgi:endonuclease/exonuclease/phosphatase family metal-dependent hydrolase